MRNVVKKISLYMITLTILLSSVQTVSAMRIPPSEYVYTPSVLVDEITDHTNKIPVYVYNRTTLYVKNGKDVIFQKYYKEEGRKTIKIKKQKGNSRLKFYLVSKDSGKKGRVVTKSVEKLPVVANEKLDKDIAKPKVQKEITSKTGSVRVTGKKGTVLVIKNEKKMLKRVKFKRDANKKIAIPEQNEGVLYFYLKRGNYRSKVVSRLVRDVTAPKAPRLKVDSGSVCVKGELGAEIYFKGANGWRHLGTSISSKWNCFLFGIDYNDIECEYFEVYLQDAFGNKSETVRIKNPSQELPDPPCI